jgi:hypothetical protein
MEIDMKGSGKTEHSTEMGELQPLMALFDKGIGRKENGFPGLIFNIPALNRRFTFDLPLKNTTRLASLVF